MPSRKIDVTPDPSLLEDIGATSFEVREAIAELVANSFDARVKGKKLTVEVFMSPEEIRVVDDGKGMTDAVLAEAVRLSVKMDQVAPSDEPRKGMFGLGLKTAAASLGQYWQVTTRTPSEKTEHSVAFDLKAWRSRSSERGFKWEAELQTEPRRASGPLGDRAHGTAVIIRKLRDPNTLSGAVADLLGRAFKGELEAGDEILVDGERATPPVITPLEKHAIDVEVDPEKHQRITGWVGLDRQTHNDSYYGLNLYRRGQLIEAWNKDFFAPHLMTSRIIGEVNFDFVPPNFHKKGFETNSAEWKLAAAEMKELLKPFVRASREMSRGKGDELRVQRALDGLHRATGAAGEIGIVDAAPSGDHREFAEPGPESEDESTDDIDVGSDTLVLSDGPVHLTAIVQEMQSEELPWDYIFDASSRELQAIVNSASRLFSSTKDQKSLGVLALADTVVAFLVDEKGLAPTRARDIRNRWLFLALAPDPSKVGD